MYNEIQLKKIFRGLQGPEFSVTIQEVQEETSFKENKRWFPKIWKGLVQRVEEGREGPFALELNTKKPFGYFQWHVCAKKQQDGTGTDWDPHVSNVWATLRITPDCLVSCLLGPIFWTLVRAISSVSAPAGAKPFLCNLWEHASKTEVQSEHLGGEIMQTENGMAWCIVPYLDLKSIPHPSSNSPESQCEWGTMSGNGWVTAHILCHD